MFWLNSLFLFGVNYYFVFFHFYLKSRKGILLGNGGEDKIYSYLLSLRNTLWASSEIFCRRKDSREKSTRPKRSVLNIYIFFTASIAVYELFLFVVLLLFLIVSEGAPCFAFNLSTFDTKMCRKYLWNLFPYIPLFKNARKGLLHDFSETHFGKTFRNTHTYYAHPS